MGDRELTGMPAAATLWSQVRQDQIDITRELGDSRAEMVAAFRHRPSNLTWVMPAQETVAGTELWGRCDPGPAPFSLPG